MSDELDFPKEPEPSVVFRVATVAAACGALAGGIEGLGLALGTRVPLGAGGSALLVLCAVALDAAVGLALGTIAGAVAALPGRRVLHWKRLRTGAALSVLLLALFLLGPLARELWVVQDRRAASAGMVALAVLVSVTFWFNANYWFRRESIGAGPRVGWRVYAPLAGGVFALLGAVFAGDPGGPEAAPPPNAPNLVLVTVDTLRRDHVGAFGGVANTPVLDQLAREGLAFDQALTPVPETAPSHASMLTGLHPAVHKVVANGIALREGYQTATEYLALSGWRTGAFVSSFAAGGTTGLQQGFQVYDDDFVPFARGVGRTRVARLALPLLLRFGDPASWPWLLERRAPDTIAHALDWMGKGSGPAFLWVHLFEPHSPYERHCEGDGECPNPVGHRAILAKEPGYSYTADEETALRELYRGEVEYTDGQIGRLLDGLRAQGALQNALVIVTGDHGESLGEHGIRFNHHGLYDDVLRVPMIVWSSNPPFTPGTHIPRPVSVSDVANTLLEYAGVPLLSGTESLPLLTHTRGVDVEARPLLLLGRLQASRSAGQLYGVRDPAGVKFVQGDAGEELYDLGDDPGELTNIAADQPNAVEQGRANVATLKRALGEQKPAETDERLKALGYVQ